MSSGSQVHEVPLSTVLDTALTYWRMAVSRWPILMASALIGGALAYFYAVNTPNKYEAQLTFLVNEENSGIGGVGGILGNIGLGSGIEAYNLDKIVALSYSNKIMSQVLLDTIEVRGRTDLVANHVIEVQGLDEEWKLPSSYRIDGSSLSSMSDTARALLRNITSYVNDEGVLEVETESETGILTISSRFQDEDLSLYCTTELYEVLSSFYTTQSVSSRRATVEKLQLKADSLKRLLESAETRLARRTDTRLGVLGRESRLGETRLEREIPLIGAAYGQVLTNLETSSFALSTSTPFFSKIDTPFTPLPAIKSKPLVAAIGGTVSGFFIAFIVLSLLFFFAQMRTP